MSPSLSKSTNSLLNKVTTASRDLTAPRARLLRLLSEEGKSTAGRLCHVCAIGNLSDTVIKMQPILKKHGLSIRHYAPHKPLNNSFGEPSQVHYWELVLLEGYL